jgi:hypothetical protein
MDYATVLDWFFWLITGGLVYRLVRKFIEFSHLDYVFNSIGNRIKDEETGKKQATDAISELVGILPPEKINGGTVPKKWFESLYVITRGRKVNLGSKQTIAAKLADRFRYKSILRSMPQGGTVPATVIWSIYDQIYKSKKRQYRLAQISIPVIIIILLYRLIL